jgi:hypothetical protein
LISDKLTFETFSYLALLATTKFVALCALVTAAYVDVEPINVKLQRDWVERERGWGGGALFFDAINREDYIAAIAREINIRMWLWWSATDRRNPISSEKNRFNVTSCTKMPHALARDRT